MSKTLHPPNASPGPQSPMGSPTPVPIRMFGLQVSIGEAQNLVGRASLTIQQNSKHLDYR